MDEPYFLAPKHIDLPFNVFIQQIVFFMVRNPVISVFVVAELFHWFQNNTDIRFALCIDELGTVFVRVNHQIKVVGDSDKIICPNRILVGVEF
jgi:hypothetical protein